MADSNLIDAPKAGDDQDLLGVSRYINALAHFLENAAMPTTIAIQGEWGSGKTSVINSLRYKLCDTLDAPEDNKPFHSIFLNMWEHCLLKEPADAVESIVRGLLDDVTLFLEKHNHQSPALSTIKKISQSTFFKAAMKGGRMASAIYGGSMVENAIDKLESAMSGEKDERPFKPEEFRKAVCSAVEECIRLDHEAGATSRRGFMVFVDDLDRINPEMAVQILEVIKNFFEVNKCIFVLAIDYNVVVKGLKAKLGNKDENDERAYRSFFDKIIQMPFTMPTEKYRVDRYVADALMRIGYCAQSDLDDLVFDDEGEENDRTFIQMITDITSNTTGTNPRSIKRLLNSLSLLQYMYVEDSAEDMQDDRPSGSLTNVQKVINYAMVCIQIAYPEIYRMLSREPVYRNWNSNTAEAFKLHNFPEYFEEWKKEHGLEGESAEKAPCYPAIIDCFCRQGTPWLQNRASSIQTVLYSLDRLCQLNKLKFEQEIPAILDMSAVTAVSSEEDKRVQVKHTVGDEKRIGFWDEFQNYAFRDEEFAGLFRRMKASKNNWLNYATGNAGCRFTVTNAMNKGRIAIDLTGNVPEIYELLESHKAEIEADSGLTLTWYPICETRKYYVISIEMTCDSKNPENWPEISRWVSTTMVKLRRAIAPYIDKK